MKHFSQFFCFVCFSVLGSFLVSCCFCCFGVTERLDLGMFDSHITVFFKFD